MTVSGKRDKKEQDVLTRIMDRIKERLERRFATVDTRRARVDNQGEVNQMRRCKGVGEMGKRNKFG